MVHRMLYDFYRVQNGKKQGSIHATYLLSGSRKKETLTNGGASKDGDDEHIQSSPFMSSMPQPEDAHEEEIPVMTISLAKEEDLEGEDEYRCLELYVLTSWCRSKSSVRADIKHTHI